MGYGNLVEHLLCVSSLLIPLSFCLFTSPIWSLLQVREAQLAQYNFILVVGEEEANTGQVLTIFNYFIVPREFCIHNACLMYHILPCSLRGFILESFFQVSVRVRDKSDHSVMSIDDLLKHFKEENDAFH